MQAMGRLVQKGKVENIYNTAMPVVNAYLEVFPDDIPRLPLEREIQFSMEPMHEGLQNQRNLRSKYRPSISP